MDYSSISIKYWTYRDTEKHSSNLYLYITVYASGRLKFFGLITYKAIMLNPGTRVMSPAGVKTLPTAAPGSCDLLADVFIALRRNG